MEEKVTGELRWFGHLLDPELKMLRIVPISDVHYGNPLCSIKHVMRTITFVNDNPDVYCVLNGDLCESTIKTSKGEIFKQVGTPQDQRDWMIEKLLPIKDKILGMTTGNHESRIYNDVGVDLSKDIAEALEVPYRAEGILIKVSFGSGNNRDKSKPYTYWLYATHGYGGARTKSAKAVKVERLSSWLDADIYIMSHDHVVNIAPDLFLRHDDRGVMRGGFLTGKITAQRKMLIKTNAYLKWGGYSEMGGFPPTDLTTPIIKLAGDGKPVVHVEV